MSRLRSLLLASALLAALALACGPDAPPAPQDPDDIEGVEGVDGGSRPDGGGPDAGRTPPPPTSFTFTTWNVENLFDEFDDPAKLDPVPSKSAVDKKLAAIAKVVKTLAPDVLAVQEVENIGILQRLAKASWPNSTMNAVLVEAFDPRGIDVGLITRFPVVKTVTHAEEKFYPPDDPRTYYRYARDCLEVHLDVNGWPVVVLVTHQISRIEPGNETRRRAEAARTREIADGLRRDDPYRPVIIAGDMNDEPGSAPIAPLLAGGGFVNIVTDVAAAERYTFVYSGQNVQLDYLLPDKGTAAGRANVTVTHTADARAASDHRPVSATFNLSN